MAAGPCRGYHCVGEAVFRNIVNQTGWALLELETFPAFSDTVQVSIISREGECILTSSLQARAAGYLEGWVTRDLVRMQYLNTIVGRCDGKEALCQQISDWVGQNTLWVRGKIQELRRKEEYWHHVGLFYDQMLGLYQGYKASLEKPEEDPVNMEDIFTMNIFGDLEDLEQAFDTEIKEPAKVINLRQITGSWSS